MKMTPELERSVTRVETSLGKLLKYTPGQPRDSEGQFAGGGGGSGGGGSGSSSGGGGSSYESYNDRIEGTQKEADREVKRTGKAVSKAQNAYDEAKMKLEAFTEATEQAKRNVVQKLESKITEIRQREAKLRVEQKEGEARMAVLKTKLAGFAKRDKERRARNQQRRREARGERSAGNDTPKDVITLFAKINQALQQSKEFVGRCKELTKDAKSFVKEISR